MKILNTNNARVNVTVISYDPGMPGNSIDNVNQKTMYIDNRHPFV